MGSVNKNKTGLVFGAALGLFHLCWAILVAIGVAKPLMDWILSLHFIEMSYTIHAFSVVTALELVVFTALVGYISGWVLAAIWNWFLKQSNQ